MKKTSLFLVLLMVCGGLAAQEMEVSSDAIKSDTLKNAVDSLNVTAPVDSLQNAAQKKVVPAVKKKVELPPLEVRNFWRLMQNFRREYNAQLERWDDIYLLITGIRPNPDYYKLSMPATYYEAPIEQAFSISDWKPQIPFIKENVLDAQLPQVADLRHSVQVDKAVNRQLLSFYLSYPSLVKQNEENLKGLKPIYGEVLVNQPRKENLLDMMQNDELPNRVTEKDLLVIKPNFWTFGGNGYLQFSQNYISKNWYKGGESTKSLLSGFTWQANYDDRQRIQFENKIEWKLGFITAPSDTVHSYKANNDLLRLSSKLGYKAFSTWYYTLSAEFKTQFFSNYETNSDNLVSAFFSPAELNVGLGMDYKFIKDGVCNLSVLVNPIDYTLYSVASDRVDPTKFNIEAGHKRESVWGSRLESTLKWKMFSILMWESRLSYTTNYEKVLGEWENTFTFTINQYLSTKLFVHGRFDDGVTREEGRSYFQLQELLSFGLSYTW